MAIILIFMMIFLSPSPGVCDSKDTAVSFTGMVNSDNVNIRSGASVHFESMGRLNKKDQVGVVGQLYEWYKIKLPQWTKCYVSRDYVYESEGEGIVYGNNVNIRSAAGTKHNIVGQLDKGDTVAIIKKHKGWFQIAPPENCFGWVYNSFIERDQ